MTRRRYDHLSGELVDEIEDDAHVAPVQKPDRSARRCSCEDGWTYDQDRNTVPCLECCRAGAPAARHALRLHQARGLEVTGSDRN